MANPLSRNGLQGRVKRRLSEWSVWCSVRSLLAGWNELPARAGRVVRGRAVLACGVGAVTHFLRVRTNSAALASPSLHRTHSAAGPTVTPIVHLPSCTHSPGSSLFCTHRFFFVAIVSRNAMFAHVSTTSTTLQHEPYRHELTRICCLCATCALLPYGRLRNHHRKSMAVSLFRLAQSKPQQVNQQHNIWNKNH